MPFRTPPPLPDFLAAELPFERGAYELERDPEAGAEAGDGERPFLHFLDHGPRDAPVVLLQHGNPTWSFLWRRVMSRLPELRCLAPDLLGLGLSHHPRRLSAHSVARHADAVTELVEALEIERLVLVGQDWGGPIVCGVGARLPERIAGLVLANTAVLVPARPRGTFFHRLARLPVASDLLFRGFGFPQCCLGRAQGDPRSIAGVAARAYRWPLRGWRRRAAPLALARMVPDGPDHPSVPELSRGEAWAQSFSGPMALVWGERDPILGRALRRHQKTFPQAPVTRTQAGHFLQEEVPDHLATAIRQVAGASA